MCVPGQIPAPAQLPQAQAVTAPDTLLTRKKRAAPQGGSLLTAPSGVTLNTPTVAKPTILGA